jgi:hypothetical protein
MGAAVEEEGDKSDEQGPRARNSADGAVPLGRERGGERASGAWRRQVGPTYQRGAGDKLGWFRPKDRWWRGFGLLSFF